MLLRVRSKIALPLRRGVTGGRSDVVSSGAAVKLY